MQRGQASSVFGAGVARLATVLRRRVRLGAPCNRALRAPALALARRLADSAGASARWIGKDALREFKRPW